MWFKNLFLFRLTRPFELDHEALNEALQGAAFRPCAKSVPFSYGWAKPLGRNGEQLVHTIGDYSMVCARKEERILPGAVVIRKTTCDAFYGTTLEPELRTRSITTLLLTGFATDFCVDSTLRSAASKDFGVIVVADAHTTADNPVLKAELVRQHHNWAWANLITRKGVTILNAGEVRFPPAAAA